MIDTPPKSAVFPLIAIPSSTRSDHARADWFIVARGYEASVRWSFEGPGASVAESAGLLRQVRLVVGTGYSGRC